MLNNPFQHLPVGDGGGGKELGGEGGFSTVLVSAAEEAAEEP